MDPEFQRVLIRVLSLGLAIGVIGAIGVYLAFRGFGEEPSKRRTLGPVMMLLFAFILICCLILLKFSVVR